ncbi:hypothetical protein LZ554_000745 [Drepanopeziza brunnea f. sp. 'monogermtubi']|nr:hypothetical protein LZ554_000745 [Drepanopeziza brunnea f. sp. 'monogermtubi']
MKLSPIPAAIILLAAQCVAETVVVVAAPRAAPKTSLSLPTRTSSLPLPTSLPRDANTNANTTTISAPPKEIMVISTAGQEAAAPRITPKPDFQPGDEAALSLRQKWHLTTYWSCATFAAGRVFCGWHEPVLPGGDEIAGASANGRGETRGDLKAWAVGALVLAIGAAL